MSFRTLFAAAALFAALSLFAQKPDSDRITIAFWNVRNLFDTLDDPRKRDNEFTPGGKERWTEEKLQKKLQMLAHGLREIDADIAGLAEVENIAVLRRLAALAGYPHAYLIERGDPRGIDMGVVSKQSLSVSNRGPGRGTLLFEKSGLAVGFIHWKSKRGGARQTQAGRDSAARFAVSLKGPVLLIGDFNENPRGPARKLLESNGFQSILSGPCASYFSGRSRDCIDGAYLRADSCHDAEASVFRPESIMQGSRPDPDVTDHLPVLVVVQSCSAR